MEQKQKVWIRGVEGRGDEVIKMLTDLGAKNCDGLAGNDPNRVYSITTDGAIACTRDGVTIETLKTYYREIKLPEKWVTGYVLDTRQPVYDTLYFYITSSGDVQAAVVKGILDYQRFRIGNFFHTRVEANGMAEKYRQLLEGGVDEHQSKQIIRHVNITTFNEDGVPITPEILRNNDFKEEVEGKYFTRPIKVRAGSSLARYLAVERKKYAWAIFIKYYNVTGYALLCHVKYVHELQFALKIVNFNPEMKV